MGKPRKSARWPVSRVLYPWFPMGDDHSSGTSVTGRLTRPTRAATRKCVWLRLREGCRPYLVLLPVGFAVPLPLPVARCALTAPFHPYRPGSKEPGWRFAFCGTFPRVAPAGRYPAPYFRGARTFLPRDQIPRAAVRPSGAGALWAGWRPPSSAALRGVKPRSNGSLCCGYIRRLLYRMWGVCPMWRVFPGGDFGIVRKRPVFWMALTSLHRGSP